VYCCHACNTFKGDWWADEDQRLLHPLQDDLSLHLVESTHNILVRLTDRGRRHIETLHLNRPELIARRRRNFREADRETTVAELLRRFDTLKLEVRRLLQSLE
jgi:RNase adaptor protein for sRNA GlmZ degradation